MAPIQHFKTAFWSQKQPELTLPDFQTGYTVLHQKLSQSRIENEEMIYFFKDRVAIEEAYATKLTDQGLSVFKANGFGRDEGAGLLKCFTQLKETSGRVGERHKKTANAINNHVLQPLQNFHEDYKRNISHSKQAIDSMLKQFDGLIKDAEKSRATYHKRCKEADRAEELAVKNVSSATPTIVEEKSQDESVVNSDNSNTKIQLGNQIMLQADLDGLVRRMRQEIHVKDHRVPILGTYKNTSTGEDIAVWLQHHLPQCKDSPAMADVVGQQLIQPYNILRLIGQRGNKFTASANAFYQWRNEDDASSIASSNTESTYASLGGLMEKITTPPLVNGTAEEPHKRARREADKSDQAYRNSVIRLDQMRMAIEEAMFAHLSEMEQVELQRIQQLKELLSSFISTLSSSIPQEQSIIEEMKVFQESIKPEQDIQFVVQQYAVSGFAPKAILYDNYYHGVSHDQVFGVPLEELGKKTEDNVPRFVKILLSVVEKSFDKIENEKLRKGLWSTPCGLDRVHSTCLELNVGSDTLTEEIFQKHEPEVLVAVLRYFLLELPECLMTYEFYDPAEALLSSGNGDENLRLTSFSNLIATLPGSHFATLKLVFENITSFIAKSEASEDMIHMICQSLGPVILRSRFESFSVLNSKISVKFVQELIKHHQQIFSESTLKLHAESEKRRLASPIVAPQSEETNKSNKRASGLMSFMRPSISTAEDLNKWTVNSVMGVFQKNTSQTELPHSPTTVNRAVPLSLGPTITQQDSPPSSPKANAIEEPKVMFDGDHIFDETTESKTEDILKDMDEKSDEKVKETEENIPTRPAPVEHIDSSFFDDDDEDE